MDKVVWLVDVREKKQVEAGNPAYQRQINQMDKLQLLEEMMHYQEERTRAGRLTLDMMVRGQILFEALERKAETRELEALARSYRRHLKFEIEALLSTRKKQNRS